MAPVPDRLQSFYDSLDLERERALARLPELFTEDIAYRDPLRQTSGIVAFRGLFESLFRKYRSVRFDGWRCDGEGERFTLSYAMHLTLRYGPTFSTPMASVYTVRQDRVCQLVDYFDFGQSLTSPLPLAGRLYRRVARSFL